MPPWDNMLHRDSQDPPDGHEGASVEGGVMGGGLVLGGIWRVMGVGGGGKNGGTPYLFLYGVL